MAKGPTSRVPGRRLVVGVAAGLTLIFLVVCYDAFFHGQGCNEKTFNLSEGYSSGEGDAGPGHASRAKFYSLKRHLLVVSRYVEDDWRWIPLHLRGVPFVLYNLNSTAEIDNQDKRERRSLGAKNYPAMGYLQFIIENYHDLPEHMVFMTGFHWSWHTRNKVEILKRLKWGSREFANLRYAPTTRIDWSCANSTIIQPEKEDLMNCSYSGPWMMPAGHQPIDNTLGLMGTNESWGLSTWVAEMWEPLFKPILGTAPFLLHSPCCGEFMVSRNRILSRPLEDYMYFRDWMLTSTHRYPEKALAPVWDVTWHYIFGEPPVIEPAFECDLLACDSRQLSKAKEAMRGWEAAQKEEVASLVANLPINAATAQKLIERLRKPGAYAEWTSYPAPRGKRKWKGAG